MARLSKGALSRQQAAEMPKYTEAQLQQAVARAKREMVAEIKKRYNREWDSQRRDDTIIDALCLTVCVPCDVLVNDFGWAPYKDSRSKLGRFVDAVVSKVNELSQGDLNAYAQDVYDRIGISFGEISEDVRHD